MDVVSGDARRAPGGKPLLDIRPKITLGRSGASLRILVWPGFMWELFLGLRTAGRPMSPSAYGATREHRVADELRAFPDGDDRRHVLTRRTDDHLRPSRRGTAALRRAMGKAG